MQIVSKLARKSFIGYQFLEHVMLTLLVIGGVPMLIFILGARYPQLSLVVVKQATERPALALLILGISAILFNVLLMLIRRMRLVVRLDLRGETLVIEIRSLLVRRTRTEYVALNELQWSRHATQALFPITNYKGYRFFRGDALMGDLFIDHFTWEEQEREVDQFLRELDRRKAITASHWPMARPPLDPFA